MSTETPATRAELEVTLRQAASAGRWINLEGGGSKRAMGGAIAETRETVSMACLNRVLEYEPRDLTVSVEAGMPWRELVALLAENGQMLPLDPPYADTATVGGVIAANSSGPRRRLYGTARDFVIGTKFLTLEGKTVQSGGMVVKNVAGLDMAKLMIGSFGTLAAILSVNFKVVPVPETERTFLISYPALADAAAASAALLSSVLQPAAVDLLNPAGANALGYSGWVMAVRAEGSEAAVTRYAREMAALGSGDSLEGPRHREFWRAIEEFASVFRSTHADGAVARASATLKETGAVLEWLDVPALARAGSGVSYACFDTAAEAASWAAAAAVRGWKAVVESAPVEQKSGLEMWPLPGGDLALMQRLKNLFDPNYVLNRGRLYNRI
jgi:glycolate oxidase FAD binding subunit